jgi:hypothetical protein
MNPARPKHELIAFAALIALTLVGALALLLAGPNPTGPAPASASMAPEAGQPVTQVVHADKAAKKPAREKRQHKPKPQAHKDKPLAEVTNAAGEPLDVTGDCEESLQIAAKQGLTLPDGWKIYCVGPGLDWDGNSHWGVTCPYDSCPEGAGPYVSISNPTYYVVSHELCHANFGNDELMADQCAAEHGASLDTSPYQ